MAIAIAATTAVPLVHHTTTTDTVHLAVDLHTHHTDTVRVDLVVHLSVQDLVVCVVTLATGGEVRLSSPFYIHQILMSLSLPSYYSSNRTYRTYSPTAPAYPSTILPSHPIIYYFIRWCTCSIPSFGPSTIRKIIPLRPGFQIGSPSRR